jgi:hypothetical protein
VGADRLNRVEVLTSRAQPGSVAISWDAREALLERLGLGEEHAAAVDAFRAVGASRPVRLRLEDKQTLCQVIDEWMYDVGGGQLPEGIFDLRNALHDDLHDTGRGP